ncbi:MULTISPECIES: type IV toxin-antitoxin system YeeU family antitoxin [Enterobacterales]|uniref:type IV toxin-antitoxin system YeeU family antitoxin n=1 Tax=Enterobacterales TaxID=91347 RepID=UPI0015771490|nr:type IV toxin-antitoxin system YeeU family antitoxin [Serratia fonticola]NTY86500.1 type IV toxin-antitoxin system YeeU family antitoxin [Serratia fonticola]NTZ12385.1 type IV toxin-antitoxin system YeeU family antitoxin [Serratia fonticola]
MVKISDPKTSNSIPDQIPYWGLQHDITPRLGARLIQQGARLHFLGDRAGCIGIFDPEVAQALELAFPVLVERLETLLRSGELDPRRQNCVAVQHADFICEADTLGSFGYVYIAVYQAARPPVAV